MELAKAVSEKARKTLMERYGAPNQMDVPGAKDKFRKHNLIKFGVEHPMQLKDYQEKIFIASQETLFDRYGVYNPMPIPLFVDKAQQNGFRIKEYIWQTGQISLIQGYEPIVLKELENQGYTYSEVKTNTTDMPQIMYYFEGTQHRYYPDFYIPKENRIIEVKSQYL